MFDRQEMEALAGKINSRFAELRWALSRFERSVLTAFLSVAG